MEQLPVFVYGTLRSGMANHRLLAGAVASVYEARLPGHVLYSCGLPYIAGGACREESVAGELMVLAGGRYGEVMQRLDDLEGFRPPDDGMYVRVVRPVLFLQAGVWREGAAWVYHGGAGFDYHREYLVPGGDWLAGRPAAFGWAVRGEGGAGSGLPVSPTGR